MRPDYWLTQTSDKPLYADLAWSRPENKQQAGKLLIVGGNLHGFAAPAEAYVAVTKAGIGTARVLLPSAIQKIVGRFIENGEFAPSTPSGSFSKMALSELLLQSNWADGVLISGDLGRNSETAVLLESFLQKSSLMVTITKDAVDYIVSAPDTAMKRERTLLVLSFSQLQRLAVNTHAPEAIRFSMDLLHLVQWLHAFTTRFRVSIIVKHLDHILVASDGQVSSTQVPKAMPIWRLTTAAHASVWWLQHSGKPFQALTAAVHEATAPSV